MNARTLRFLCTCSCLFAALFAGCTRAASLSAPVQVLRVSQRNEPADLDPATATLPDEFFIIRALSEGLVVPESTAPGGVRAATASRWEISADGLSVTFHLRANARWSNREPVTSADFIASYRRLLTPATAAPKAELFFAVKNARAFVAGKLTDFSTVGFAAPDPLTLVVTLERPTPDLLLFVASGPWIPVHPATVAAHGRDWTKPGHFVGNGPFTLGEWRSQQRIVVKKNPAYHSAAATRIDEIQFLRYDSADTEERAYRAGQLDVTMDVPKTKIETYAAERPAELHRAALAETRFLSFNLQRPPLTDERVRRALALAIDRDKIVDRVLRGGQEPAIRFVPTVLRPESKNTAIDGEFRHESAEARRLLAAAGFPEGRNFPRLELAGWSNNPVLEAIQAMWRQELGIEVALTVREAKVHLAALHAGTYDIAFATTLLDLAERAHALEEFSTGAVNNFPHWSSPEFDAALQVANAERDAGRRALSLDHAETLLLRAAPLAPVYFNTRNWLMAPRVRGWHEDALWTRSYQAIYLDEK